MQENKTLRRIAEQLGPEEILCQCAEECSELAQAVLKMRRALVGTTPLTQGEGRGPSSTRRWPTYLTAWRPWRPSALWTGTRWRWSRPRSWNGGTGGPERV